MTNRQKQHLLAYLGYYTGTVDGIWGALSEQATRELQRDHDLREDGIYGELTHQAAKYAVANDLFKAAKDINVPSTGGDFWDHIRYWSREEFRCQCGGKYCNGFPAEPDQTLVELVDDIRHEAGAPGYRSSGLRCETHNRNEGGVANSRHMYGKALDFYVEGVSGKKLLAIAQDDPRTNYAYQIRDNNGNLTNYIHVDVK